MDTRRNAATLPVGPKGSELTERRTSSEADGSLVATRIRSRSAEHMPNCLEALRKSIVFPSILGWCLSPFEPKEYARSAAMSSMPNILSRSFMPVVWFDPCNAEVVNDSYLLFLLQSKSHCPSALSPRPGSTEEARTCEAWFQLTLWPQKWNLKAHMWYQLSPFPSSNVAICDAATPRQHSPILRYSALLRYSVLWFNSITQCNWHDIETVAE